MQNKNYLTAFFKIASVLVFVFYLTAPCPAANTTNNVLSIEEFSAAKTFEKPAANTETNFKSMIKHSSFTLGGDTSHVYFTPGNQCPPPQACYVNQLKVSGTGADGYTGSWTSPWFSQPVSYIYNDWWWRPDSNISLDFYIGGYGWRSCVVYMSRPWNGFPTTVNVNYTGNYTCQIW